MTRALLVATGALLALMLGAARADAVCGNPISCENEQPGTPGKPWAVAGAGDPSIQGYATQMSVNRGETIAFKIRSVSTNYRIDVYRLGYYGGAGSRRVAANIQPAVALPQSQPACVTDPSTGLIDCGNWSTSASWSVPADAVSGVYIAHLVREDVAGSSQILFVVRDDDRPSDVLLSTSDADWQAYNSYGGNSLYTCTVGCPPDGAPQRAFKVSYNRPFNTAADAGGRPWFFRAEYAMIRFLEASGYDLSYTTSVDVQSRASTLVNHRVFMSSGQDEYWAEGQRTNVEAAREAGVNLAFFSGNELFWKTRWEASVAGPPTANRTLVSYKETHADAAIDPSPSWTGTWQDPRFSPPKDGGRPQNALTGQVFSVNTGPAESSSGTMTVPAAYGQLRLWRNTAAATLPPGGTLALAPKTIGFEWDEDFDNGFRPEGLIRLSSTTLPAVEIFTDYGTELQANRAATHTPTLYRAPSGALVFGAGTVQWSWGLDSDQPQGNPPDDNMRQATVNLLADMDAQPDVLLPGVQAASKSADTARPQSTLTAPPASVADGQRVTLAGSAADSGGGVVAGVEVSTDGGASWHPATLTTRTSWTYSWTVHGGNPAVIRTRATDDSANIERAGAGTSVRVSCPCSLWGTNVTPDLVDSADPADYELGVRFTSDVPNIVTGVRFYKSELNTGPHSGRLWQADGRQLLAQVTFAGESAQGWQSAQFDAPVAIEAGTTYVISYSAPNGHYSATRGYFYPPPAPGPRGGAIVDSPPLHAQRTGPGAGAATTNGVFSENPGFFPAQSFNATNYWVDVVLGVRPPDQVADGGAGLGGSGAPGVAPAPGTDLVPGLGEPVAPTSVLASLRSARILRSADGRRRVLRISLTVGETVTLSARLTRGARTLAPATRRRFFRGRRTFSIALPRRVSAGSAQLRLVFTDAAGATKTLRRTLAVPRLRRR
jgi:hypothetical protein